jgi:hypothetical protein
MKTRNGFVSNSSSSSFVVGFKKVPTDDYEMVDILYPKNKKDPYKRPGVTTNYNNEDLDSGVDAMSAAVIIFLAMKGQKPLTKKQMLEEIRGGWFDGYPKLDYSTEKESDKIRKEYEAKTGFNITGDKADPAVLKKYRTVQDKEWKEERKKVDAAAVAYLEKIWPKFKGLKCFQFTFSDGDGCIFSTLEHGNTFRNVPHIRISHH